MPHIPPWLCLFQELWFSKALIPLSVEQGSSVSGFRGPCKQPLALCVPLVQWSCWGVRVAVADQGTLGITSSLGTLWWLNSSAAPLASTISHTGAGGQHFSMEITFWVNDDDYLQGGKGCMFLLLILCGLCFQLTAWELSWCASSGVLWFWLKYWSFFLSS